MAAAEPGAWLGKHRRRVRRLSQIAHRTPLVRERVGFARAQLSTVEVALPYTLRSSGLRFYIRHNTSDEAVFDKIFVDRAYELPGLVRTRVTALGGRPRLLDLGAHVGLFGAWFLDSYPGASITAVEPNPLNAVILRRTARANGRVVTWAVIDAAAWNSAGRARIELNGAASRLILDSSVDAVGAVGVDLVDVFDLLPRYDLVKIDIEGAEWRILTDARLALSGPDILVLEYHEECPGCRDARRRAQGYLRGAGYAVHEVAAPLADSGLMWAWRDPASHSNGQVGAAVYTSPGRPFSASG